MSVVSLSRRGILSNFHIVYPHTTAFTVGRVFLLFTGGLVMLVALIPTAVLASVDTGTGSVQAIGVCYDFISVQLFVLLMLTVCA